MATADSVKAKLQGLIDKSNATTGNTDADLTTAVDALVEGFGKATHTQAKYVSITENGTTEVTPDEGYALSKVTVSTQVGGEDAYDLASLFEENTYEVGTINLPNVTNLRKYAFYQSGAHIRTGNIVAPNLVEIGAYAFSQCRNMVGSSLPSSIKRIGDNAFRYSQSLALTNLPSGLESLGSGAFSNCKKIELSSLPNSVTSLPTSCFYNCTSITEFRIHGGVTSVASQSFGGCYALTKVTFEGKPNSMQTNIFLDCSALKEINVPWAEGEVVNAPWGATNATINYNYTEG